MTFPKTAIRGARPPRRRPSEWRAQQPVVAVGGALGAVARSALARARSPAGGATTLSTCASASAREVSLPPGPDNTRDKTDSGGKKSL
ncbi:MULTISPECIES: hypothetical protein [Streptomyces]|uniref:Uncharacterized protein n=1 Tax=Streptomyces canarius TaxID=285453 RepID=A0ABQ3CLU7_9ACTN|nr:hypothetical protein [Streptomyces canarius]GHA24450.1 hypothetical protein GCM10010345_31620 [Streptomyces canarius]